MPLDEKSAAKIQSALRKLEEAQNRIEDAAQLLSYPSGFADDWDKTCKLRDSVQKLWFELEGHYLRESRNFAPASP